MFPLTAYRYSLSEGAFKKYFSHLSEIIIYLCAASNNTRLSHANFTTLQLFYFWGFFKKGFWTQIEARGALRMLTQQHMSTPSVRRNQNSMNVIQ